MRSLIRYKINKKGVYTTMKRKLLAVAMAVVMTICLLPMPVSGADPTVTITVSATVISITNTEATWAIGVVEAGDGATKWGASNTHSQVNNTGNVAVDVEIQGTNLTDGYNWTLGAAAANKTYQLYANTQAVPETYDVEVAVTGYNDLLTNLTADSVYNWSMEFTPPTIFDPDDDGANKTATITLVASKHV